jgi:hypothetical protein
VEGHVVEGSYGKNDARVACEGSADVYGRGRSDGPIKLGMKRKMFSYGWSSAVLLVAAVPLALPFARFRTSDIVGGIAYRYCVLSPAMCLVSLGHFM